MANNILYIYLPDEYFTKISLAADDCGMNPHDYVQKFLLKSFGYEGDFGEFKRSMRYNSTYSKPKQRARRGWCSFQLPVTDVEYDNFMDAVYASGDTISGTMLRLLEGDCKLKSDRKNLSSTKKIGVALPKDVFNELYDQAKAQQISKAALVRAKIFEFEIKEG